MIISESVERFNIVKEYLETLSFSSKKKIRLPQNVKHSDETELEMNIINADYNESQRWFYINAIKQ